MKIRYLMWVLPRVTGLLVYTDRVVIQCLDTWVTDCKSQGCWEEDFFGDGEEMDGRDGTREETQDTTRLVEIEEVKRDIRALLIVTKLSLVDAHKDKVDGWGASLKCASCPG
jgi:hypothetical protein